MRPLAPSSDTPLVTLEIQDLSRGGAGVAREESGRVIFVPLTAPGDRVVVRITEAEKRYAQGELVEILKPSPLRQEPPCPVFGRCGGCAWQHLPYEHQWKTKVEGLRHALARVLIDANAVPHDELPAKQVWNYRNRIQLRGEGAQLGFFAPKSRELVPIEQCAIARPELNAVLGKVRAEGAARHRPYKVELEVSESGEVRMAWNAPHAALGFRQVHDGQNEVLRQWVGARLTEGRQLYDLFGGSANLSLPLAARMSRIDCVDTGVPRVRPPSAPACLHFHRSEVENWLRGAPKPEGEASAILDPPREGLGPAFPRINESLKRLHTRELVLVGCDADAWARDLSRFLRSGWKLARWAVLDLFPQTPHVEGIAHLLL